MIIGAVFRYTDENMQAIPLFVTDQYRVYGLEHLSPKEMGQVLTWSIQDTFPATLPPFMSVPGALFVDAIGYDPTLYQLSERLDICLYSGFRHHEALAEAGIKEQMSG